MSKRATELPTKEQVLAYIQANSSPFSKRDLVRAFNISGDLRMAFKALVKELIEEGALQKTHRNNITPTKLHKTLNIKPVMTLEVEGVNEQSQTILRPTEESDGYVAEDFPLIILLPASNKHETHKLEPGQRIMVRLRKVDDNLYHAQLIKAFAHENRHIMAIYRGSNPRPHATPIQNGRTGYVTLDLGDLKPKPQEVILVEITSPHRHDLHGTVLKILGEAESTNNAVMMTILSREIPHEFSKEAHDAAKSAKPAPLEKREDLRSIPLVTIDGEDARDFDDAVFAEPDSNPDNTGGWHLIVAIADVAYYVTPHNALDRAAYERGNSVYFPGTVIPMLPEQLSNDLCSLKPGVDRASLVAHMWIDAHGKMFKYKFSRALIRSFARLTYHEVELALGHKDHALEPIITPLHKVFKLLRNLRDQRGALNIESRENQIMFDAENKAVEILVKEQLVSHKIIEEFMVLANVAAAKFLEDKKLPCMYRIHAKPDPVKTQALRDFLIPLQLLTAKTQLAKGAHFNDLLNKTRNSPFSEMINEMVLRSQSQAVYSPKNIGHFGLSLVEYAHFTSPIRRYSDLIVHRSILTALGEKDGQSEELLRHDSIKTLEDIGIHISATERRAAEAEREVMSKYIAEIMQSHLGEVFDARISSVLSFGFFVTVIQYGIDGLVHIKTLDPRDYFIFDPKRHLLRGERTKKTYTFGDKVRVKLTQADIISGKLTFQIEEEFDDTKTTNPSSFKKKYQKKKY